MEEGLVSVEEGLVSVEEDKHPGGEEWRRRV
jgi:hypothetical protein